MNGYEGKLRSEQSVCWFRAVKGTSIIPGEGPFKDVQVYLPQTYRLAYCLHRFLHVKALLGTQQGSQRIGKFYSVPLKPL